MYVIVWCWRFPNLNDYNRIIDKVSQSTGNNAAINISDVVILDSDVIIVMSGGRTLFFPRKKGLK